MRSNNMCAAHKKQLDQICALRTYLIEAMTDRTVRDEATVASIRRLSRATRTRGQENGDDPKHRITAPDAGSEPVLKYVQANGVRFAYLEQGSGPLVHVPARLSRQRLVISKAAAGIRGCGISCGRAVLARLCADRDSGGRHFRSDRTGQGSRSAHRCAERRRTGPRRRHGLGRHVDFSGAGHGAIGDQGRRGHEHRAPDHIRSIRRDPEIVRSIFHVYFFQLPGAESAVNIEGLPFVDYLWKLWSPTFNNAEHIRSIKETLSSPGTMAAALKYYGGLTDAGRRAGCRSMTCTRRR